MSKANEEYIPALSYRFLTPFYDFIQKYIVRDIRYKSLLIEQAKIQPGQHVLDLGCGTGTLALMVKEAQPSADVAGLDADPDMLKVAKYKSAQMNAPVKFDFGNARADPGISCGPRGPHYANTWPCRRPHFSEPAAPPTARASRRCID